MLDLIPKLNVVVSITITRASFFHPRRTVLNHLLHASSLLAIAAMAAAQHCGGPCEVPRGAEPVSASTKYTLSEGIEKSNWRYLFNWYWTEDGVQKHALEAVLGSPPLRDFAYRRMFVSPAGNGFLVTGNPYAATRLEGREPPLFVFCDPEGKRLVEVPLRRALNDKERRLGKCPSCDCCSDILHVFAQDPALSGNGCFVELNAAGTNRSLAFFLPLGLPVRNRTTFEVALEEGEWSSLAPPQQEQHRKAISGYLDELASDDLKVRTRAADGLVAKGFLALAAVRKARDQSKSGDYRARTKAVELRLQPWRIAGWEALAIDLGLSARLLVYPDPDVVQATQNRLASIVPATRGMDAAQCATWIAEHRTTLRWNAVKGYYE